MTIGQRSIAMREQQPQQQGARVQTVRHEISGRTLGTLVFIAGAIWLTTRLWPILVVIVASLILAGTLSPAVTALERRRIRRTSAVVIVFASVAMAVLLLALLIAPPLGRQVLQFIEDAPATQARLAAALDHYPLTVSLAEAIRHFRPDHLLSGQSLNALSYSTVVAEGIGYGTTSIVLALYLVADRDRARGALYSVVPRSNHMLLARILLNLELIVGGYMRGQLITSLAIGAFVFTLLTACRVQGALAVAAFAALTDVIPFVGGLLATAPAVLAALSRSVSAATLVAMALVFYQSFESRVLVPRIYGRALRLPSAVVIIALMMGGKLLGIVGALLALPIAAGLRMVGEELHMALPGDATDGTAQRERDEQAEQSYAARTSGAAPGEAAAVASQIADALHNTDAIDAAEAARAPLSETLVPPCAT